jgi:hypothetical protein
MIRVIGVGVLELRRLSPCGLSSSLRILNLAYQHAIVIRVSSWADH